MLQSPIEAYLQMAKMRNDNQQKMNENIAGVGTGLGQGFNSIGQAMEERKKKELLDQIVAAIQANGAPQQGPAMPPENGGPQIPSSGMGAPAQDNTNLIKSLMTQYDPKAAMEQQLKEESSSPWNVVPSVLVDGKPVQQNKRTGMMRPGPFEVTPTGRGNAAFGTGSIDWSTATDEDKNIAKALYEGRVRPFDLSYRDRGTGVKLANQYALLNGLPAYKSYAGDVASGTAKAFASGKQGNNVLALNTALGHLDTANDAYEAVKNTNQAWLNQPINKLKKATNDPNIVRLTTALNAVRGEAANVFKSNGATDQEIKSWEGPLSENLTPQQAIGTIGMLDELFRSRIKALEYMRQQGMQGRAEGPLISPKASEISKKIETGSTKKSVGLSPAERAELQKLEKKFGGK